MSGDVNLETDIIEQPTLQAPQETQTQTQPQPQPQQQESQQQELEEQSEILETPITQIPTNSSQTIPTDPIPPTQPVQSIQPVQPVQPVQPTPIVQPELQLHQLQQQQLHQLQQLQHQIHQLLLFHQLQPQPQPQLLHEHTNVQNTHKRKSRTVFFSGRYKQLLKERENALRELESRALVEDTVTVDVYHYSPSRVECKSITISGATVAEHETLTAQVPEWATVAWVSVDGINEAVLQKLAVEFDLHPIALEDVIEIQHRPKMDFFGNVMCLTTSTVAKTRTPSGKVIISTDQVSFFLVGKTLVTIQQGIPDVWQRVIFGIRDQDSLIRNCDTGFLLYALLAGIVDTCKPLIDELEDSLEDLEGAIMENPSNHLNKMVYAAKRHQLTANILQKILPEEATNDLETLPSSVTSANANNTNQHGHGAPASSTRSLPALFEGPRVFSDVTTTYFRDLFGVITHLCEEIEQQKEVATSLTSLHLHHEAHRQGRASLAIAIVSVFFFPLTFVAGVYGMNFVNMPELNWEKGYLYVWMVFIGIVIFEIILFHKIGWIQLNVSKRLKRKDGNLPSKYYQNNSLISPETDSAMSEVL